MDRKAKEEADAQAAAEIAALHLSGTLLCTVHAAEGLQAISGSGRDTWRGMDISDPYCRISLLTLEYATAYFDGRDDSESVTQPKDIARTEKVFNGGSDPVWQADPLRLTAEDTFEERLLVQIFDSDEEELVHSDDDLLAQMIIPVNKVLRETKEGPAWFNMHRELKDGQGGRIKLSMHICQDL